MDINPSKQIILPREIHYRMTIAFSVATIIPILIGLYLLTVHVPAFSFYQPWLRFLMVICAILGGLGILLIRTSVWKVVDIACTTDEILVALKNDKSKGKNAEELLRVERLVLYMEDQVRAARRSLELYREITKPLKHFKLPRQLPAQYAKAKTKEMIENSLESKINAGLIYWRNSEVCDIELNDDSFVPDWLSTIIRDSSIIPEAIGRFGPGEWVCWLEGNNAEEINSQAILFQEAIPEKSKVSITFTYYFIPDDKGKLNSLFK